MTPRAASPEISGSPGDRPGLLRFCLFGYDVGMLKRGGTRLGTIPKHHLFVECGTPGCEHAGPVKVAWLIEQYGDQVTVADVISKMQCTRCRQQSVKQYSITYQGGSMDAMRGADQQRGPTRPAWPKADR